MRINVHGGGYVGLTGASHYANAGHTVIITDPDESVVDAINAGKPKAGGFLAYLDSLPAIRAISGIDLEAEAHIVAVPSEKNGEPFMAIVEELFSVLCVTTPKLVPIIIESTLMPGMAEQLRHRAYSLSPERPWAIAPRRDWFADRTKNLATLTRIVGCDRDFVEAISPIISAVCYSTRYTTPETAEITKALENALLHLPVVLLHELALLFPDYDIAEAAELASTHWRFQSLGQLYLGLGTGGRCVPLGSKYLNARGGALLGDAIEVDESFAAIAITEILRGVPQGFNPAPFLVLGIAYRPGFKDAGNSPGLRVALALDDQHPDVHDPYFSVDEIQALRARQGMRCIATCPSEDLPRVDQYRTIILTVAHPEYAELWIHLRPGMLVIDATGLWESALENRLDLEYVRPGRAGWIAQSERSEL